MNNPAGPRLIMNKILYSMSLKGYYAFLHIKCGVIGLRFVPPNYAFFSNLINSEGIAVDVGVGNNPDFTHYIIKKYSAIESYIVDPTLKHMKKLKEFESNNPKVHYLPFALGSKNESRTFYESQSNESGSLKKDHKNAKEDKVIEYSVQVITLDELLSKCGNKQVVILKIDIEGEEYGFVNSISKENLKRIKQLIIEFHHDIVGSFSISDTIQAKKTIESMGMKSILYNGRDCLFYWSN
jgi:FkbM family methyltransferase